MSDLEQSVIDLVDGLTDGEFTRLRSENEALRAAIQCERESGTCVTVHDPEREPCTAENCKFMAALGEQR